MEEILWISIGLVSLLLLSGLQNPLVSQLFRVWTFLLAFVVVLSVYDEEWYFGFFVEPKEETIVYFTRELNQRQGRVVNVRIHSMNQDERIKMAYRVKVLYEIENIASCSGSLLLSYRNKTWYGQKTGIDRCQKYLKV